MPVPGRATIKDCRLNFAPGAPLARPSKLAYRPRAKGPDANRLGVYYHPELATWVAHLGDPSAPILEAHQPSSVAALVHLLAAIQAQGHRFDDEWSPV
jgi:hypothetical protein